MALKKNYDEYEPLDISDNDYADMAGMSEIDRAALTAAGESWTAADKRGDQAGREAAHKQAEAIRQRYNYSGGADGSQYLPGDGFSYERAPQYLSQYQKLIDTTADKILNRKAFTYNPETDPMFAQYRDTYTREGSRAMQDTLGQMSARTGGLASSYAGTAAQQTYNGYMQELADKVPELRQLAYEMYLQELEDDRADLNMLMGLESNDYDRYLTDLGQFNTDRSFQYGVFADDRDYDYGKERDAVEDQRYTEERDYARLAEQAQMLASVGDFSGYKALGYTDSQIAKLQKAYQQEQAASGGGGDDTPAKPRLTLNQVLEAIENGNITKNVLDGYEYYYGEPYAGAEKDLTDLDTRNEMYGQLGDAAKQTLSNIQRGNSRNGQRGITDGQKAKLEKAVTEGQIEDWELGVILDLLGY